MPSALTDNQSMRVLPAAAACPAAPDRLLPIREVQQQCGMGKTAIYDGIRAGTFPAPAKLGKSSRWLQSEIQQFIADRAAVRP